MLISFLRDNLRGYGFSIFKALADADEHILSYASEQIEKKVLLRDY